MDPQESFWPNTAIVGRVEEAIDGARTDAAANTFIRRGGRRRYSAWSVLTSEA